MSPFDGCVHFHSLSSPGIAAYAIPPHLLRERLGALVKKYGLALTITESHDAAELAPAMRETLATRSGVHSELAGEYAGGALLMLNIGIPRRGCWGRKISPRPGRLRSRDRAADP